MKKALLSFAALALLVSGSYGQSAYVRSIKSWRDRHQAELLKDDGWLTLAGLFWLHEGANSIGHGEEYDVQLTDSFTGDRFGEIILAEGVATLKVRPGVEAVSDGKTFTSLQLEPEIEGKATRVHIGSQTIYMIERNGRYAIRLKDTNNRPRREFTGLNWYPIRPVYRVIATLDRFPEPKEIDIPNVLGGIFKLISPGILRFQIGGREMTLQPVLEDEKLFIVFRDPTSRSETYGAGRFLYAEQTKSGQVILDFNKAENPPCAFTEFATCPLPPQQNRLSMAIPAGEKRYEH